MVLSSTHHVTLQCDLSSTIRAAARVQQQQFQKRHALYSPPLSFSFQAIGSRDVTHLISLLLTVPQNLGSGLNSGLRQL